MGSSFWSRAAGAVSVGNLSRCPPTHSRCPANPSQLGLGLGLNSKGKGRGSDITGDGNAGLRLARVGLGVRGPSSGRGRRGGEAERRSRSSVGDREASQKQLRAGASSTTSSIHSLCRPPSAFLDSQPWIWRNNPIFPLDGAEQNFAQASQLCPKLCMQKVHNTTYHAPLHWEFPEPICSLKQASANPQARIIPPTTGAPCHDHCPPHLAAMGVLPVLESTEDAQIEHALARPTSRILVHLCAWHLGTPARPVRESRLSYLRACTTQKRQDNEVSSQARATPDRIFAAAMCRIVPGWRQPEPFHDLVLENVTLWLESSPRLQVNDHIRHPASSNGVATQTNHNLAVRTLRVG
ncbi:hypothetical protein JOL62DRAFT_137709 [Phyllosticta paracitricarpa]|uniref:Uncharacterized protein n=1 Tax=Phyllosticta paracitricarpa TaxID=2016321 RepID=A0ABR1NL86_9PEZI